MLIINSLQCPKNWGNPWPWPLPHPSLTKSQDSNMDKAQAGGRTQIKQQRTTSLTTSSPLPDGSTSSHLHYFLPAPFCHCYSSFIWPKVTRWKTGHNLHKPLPSLTPSLNTGLPSFLSDSIFPTPTRTEICNISVTWNGKFMYFQLGNRQGQK